MKSHLFLLIVIVLALFGSALFAKRERFSNYNNDNNLLLGEFPKAVTESGVLDSYPLAEKKVVSNINSEDVWWQYPIFEVGSYDQLTNNMKYQVNPDIGRCTRIEFCDALYNDKQVKSNVIYPEPPVPNCQGKRIGYFRSPLNLLTFENPNNILY
jgi:hypothetical protein